MAVHAGDDIAISESLQLDDQMCFALYAASRAMTAVYRPLLERLELTYPQYLVMLVLWQRDGRCTVKDIGAALHLDYGTLTPLLKRLQAAGLLERTRGERDERTVQVRLTEAGAALRAEAASIPVEISRCMALSAQETADLRGLLRHLTAALATAPDGERDATGGRPAR